MRILNSATVHAPGALVERGRTWRAMRLPVRYGLIETPTRRILVDTGYGPRVLRGSRTAALRAYAALLQPRLEPLAADALDIDAVILTHLHADHVARLLDLPGKPIIASAAAIESTGNPRGALRHGVFTELLPRDFAARATAIETLARLDTETVLGDGFDLVGDGSHLAIPLPGHAIGHFGVFWRDPQGPVLYATDAAWTRHALLESLTPSLSRAIVFEDASAGSRTEIRIRAFVHDGGRVLLCHDPDQTE